MNPLLVQFALSCRCPCPWWQRGRRWPWWSKHGQPWSASDHATKSTWKRNVWECFSCFIILYYTSSPDSLIEAEEPLDASDLEVSPPDAVRQVGLDAGQIIVGILSQKGPVKKHPPTSNAQIYCYFYTFSKVSLSKGRNLVYGLGLWKSFGPADILRGGCQRKKEDGMMQSAG